MDLRRLTTFITVAETGNMTMAAGQLYISQPTVSQTITELEEHYQAKLFERYPKKLCLTEAGRRLFSHAQTIVANFACLERQMRAGPGRNFLRLGASLTVGSSVMGHLAATLKQKSKNTDLHVMVENTNTIERKLLENKLDAAIVEAEIKHPFILTEPIINDCLVLVCSRKHPLAKRQSIRLHELANEVFLMREEGSGTRALFESVMRGHGLSYQIAWESSSVESIKQAVIHNHGLAVISGRLVAGELASGKIKFLPVSDCMWKRHFLLAWHRDKNMTEELKLFMELARSYEKYGLACPLSQSDLLDAASEFHLVE
ncbi:LysR family transcriptional regulator [Deltaproteobacteria bacterium OttesenSCG-928-M10]|nr:LysR family transcriptional regulator [Deltaproteobacteria bacterium OttesenSCG-928-M10]